ncbi:putative methyltransferase protein [Lasiodiplodia theobromae]|nr:putative methyltransferase protein [Lasiodiplodia theobromae]
MTKGHIAAFYSTNNAEQKRLHAQHAIGAAAFDNQLLVFPGAQDVLARPNLRILDNAGADGFSLMELRRQLKHPESAELVSADIAPYPGETADGGEVGVGEGVRLVKQDFMEEWPREWEGRFDLVLQRTCLSFHPTWASAVAATRRLLRLLRPGGWIQLVDGAPPYGPVDPAADPPHARFFKSIGRAPSPADAANGIDPPIPHRLPQLLAEAAAAAEEEGVHLEDVGERRARSKWGAAAKGKEMQDLGVETVEGIVKNVEALWERYPQIRRVEPDEWTTLSADVMKQVREEGFEIDTAAVWGRRSL